MNIKTLISLLTTVLIAVSDSHAQAYLNLKQDDTIYDVDVIVFARQLAQPDANFIKNASLLKTEAAKELSFWDGETELLIYPEQPAPNNNQEQEWQVPIEDQAAPVQVLSWLILADSLNHPVVERLNANPTFKPIIRQKWRQPASSFNNPEYVVVSNLANNQATAATTTDLNTSLDAYFDEPAYADFSVDGQVAFSQQRFKHLHVRLNLIRQNANEEQIIYEISQQKRIELGKWQYFDHQQFGVLAQVTAVSLNIEDNE